MPDDSYQSALRFENVSVRFDDVTALDSLSFDVPPGESVVIFGAAGSGKTVLLKVALGLQKPESGKVYIFGREITELSEQDLFAIRADMGVLFQEGGLFDSLTVEENVSYPLENLASSHASAPEIHERAKEALRFVELEHTLDKFPSELSGGMRRRVGIARAVISEPRLLLYDSPTAGLDPITAYTIVALILKERDWKNTTTLMATHRYQDGHFLATSRYDVSTGEIQPAGRDGSVELRTKFLVLEEGRLVFQGTLTELIASPDPYVSKFVKRED